MLEPLRFALCVSAAVPCLLLGGCISAKSTTTLSPGDCSSADETARRIQPGKTTRGWVVAALGEPADQKETPGGTELLRYEYVANVSNHFSFFPVIDARETKKTRHELFIEIKDGVVQKYWRDTTQLEKKSGLN